VDQLHPLLRRGGKDRRDPIPFSLRESLWEKRGWRKKRKGPVADLPTLGKKEGRGGDRFVFLHVVNHLKEKKREGGGGPLNLCVSCHRGGKGREGGGKKKRRRDFESFSHSYRSTTKEGEKSRNLLRRKDNVSSEFLPVSRSLKKEKEKGGRGKGDLPVLFRELQGKKERGKGAHHLRIAPPP